jgi:hypothetical protein
VKATFYENGRYWVDSENIPGQMYLCDVVAAQCDCPMFRIRLENGKTGVECKHLREALLQFGRDMAAEIRTKIKK